MAAYVPLPDADLNGMVCMDQETGKRVLVVDKKENTSGYNPIYHGLLIDSEDQQQWDFWSGKNLIVLYESAAEYYWARVDPNQGGN